MRTCNLPGHMVSCCASLFGAAGTCICSLETVLPAAIGDIYNSGQQKKLTNVVVV